MSITARPTSPQEWSALFEEEVRLKAEWEAARERLTEELRAARAAGESVANLIAWTGAPESRVGWRLNGKKAADRRKANPIHQKDRSKQGDGPGLKQTHAAEVMGITRSSLISRMRSGAVTVLQPPNGPQRIAVDKTGAPIAVPNGYSKSIHENWPKMDLYAAEPYSSDS